MLVVVGFIAYYVSLEQYVRLQCNQIGFAAMTSPLLCCCSSAANLIQLVTSWKVLMFCFFWFCHLDCLVVIIVGAIVAAGAGGVTGDLGGAAPNPGHHGPQAPAWHLDRHQLQSPRLPGRSGRTCHLPSPLQHLPATTTACQPV